MAEEQVYVTSGTGGTHRLEIFPFQNGSSGGHPVGMSRAPGTQQGSHEGETPQLWG